MGLVVALVIQVGFILVALSFSRLLMWKKPDAS